jgi:hypothetical protein
MKFWILPDGVLGESPSCRKPFDPARSSPGFVVESAVCDSVTTLITVCPTSRASACPECGVSSHRIHSRYLRRVTDLPMAGREVRLARRFRCAAVSCRRRIFTERFNGSVLAPWARRTARLDHVVHHLGLALGGRPAASFFARRLMLPREQRHVAACRPPTRHSVFQPMTPPGKNTVSSAMPSSNCCRRLTPRPENR